MTRSLISLVAALCLLSAYIQPAEKKTNVEDQIAALERSWAAAQKANDVSTVAAVLADSFIEILPDGSLMTKSQVLDDTKAAKYDAVELSGMKITKFGDTVIVIGTYDAKHFDKDGKPLQDHERYVDTWRKMPNGNWQCIAEGNTAIH